MPWSMLLCGSVARAAHRRFISRFAIVGALAIAALVSLPGASASAAWNPAACIPDPLQVGFETNWHCIGHRLIRARGEKPNARCLETYTGPYGVYPYPTFCGGNGYEYIAQARAVSYLGGSVPRIAQNTQWEVQVHDSKGRGFADITYETQGAVDVFEAKRISYGIPKTLVQVQRYVDALNAAGVGPPARLGDGPLHGWVDVFLLPDRDVAPCEVDGKEVFRFRAYISTVVVPGVLMIFPSETLPCFDPERSPVPRPAPVPVPIPEPPAPIPAPAPGPTPPRPAPGTVPPGPNNPSGVPGGGNGSGNGGSSGGGSGVHLPDIPWGPIGNWAKGRINDFGDILGALSGEPHINTIDGLGYDFQAVGEFQLVESDELGLDIQVRTEPWGDSASVLDRVATNLNGYTVELAPVERKLWIDGSLVDLPSGRMFDLGAGAYIVRDQSAYYLVWPGEADDRPVVGFGTTRFVGFSIPQGSDMVGLLGNADGLPENDLVTGAGEQLPADASPAVIHGEFADSWRLADDESLFTYAEGESTETFTDRSFPRSIVSIADLDDATLAEATALCEDAGVIDGRQFDDCVVDWAITRDSEFLAAAAAVTAPVTEGGAHTVGPDGTVGEDFDGVGVAPNFSSSRYGTGAGSGTFAGSFGRDDRYVFYVPKVPTHLDATVTLDVVALGGWNPLDNNTVSITVDGALAWQGNPATGTPSETGTTPSGQAYAVYPVTFTLPHTAGQLNVGVSAELPIGTARAFGIDNVSAHFTLVPPQEFAVSLPASISDGVPAVGAGNLETTSSEDAYSFSTDTAGRLRLDFSDCSSSVGYVFWKLIDAASGATVSSNGGCTGVTVPDLPAGSYRLSVTRNGKVGTYRLAMFLAPTQAFDVTLPVSVSDGVPVAGAGRLETTASEDVYRFSTSAAGTLQIDMSCPGGMPTVRWTLYNAASGAVLGTDYGCMSFQVPNLPAGSYRLSVNGDGTSNVTYGMALGLQPPPQYFAVSLPASISDGVPAAGAGNLEMSSSEDVYAFTTEAKGRLRLDFSTCSSSLGYVNWKLVNAASGATVTTNGGCSGTTVPNLAAGSYRLSVTRNGKVGTYRLGMFLAPTQVFDVTLPLTVSDGLPTAGAGNLETSASEDEFRFSTAAAGTLQIDMSCPGGMPTVNWTLYNAITGAAVRSDYGCMSFQVANLPAGSYRMSVTKDGTSNVTYGMALGMQPPPQEFAVSLPASIDDGVPAAGAGNLESSSSEDVYAFTTQAKGRLRLEFSTCSSSLGYVNWKLVNAASGATVTTNGGCSGTTVPDLPAGSYRVSVTRNGKVGTYRLEMLLSPPEVFDVTLPVTVSDGVPAAGAGNLETSASEDEYRFSTSAVGTLQIDMSCPAGMPTVRWTLFNATTGSMVRSDYGCMSFQVANLPAGSYRMSITKDGTSNVTYGMQLRRN